MVGGAAPVPIIIDAPAVAADAGGLASRAWHDRGMTRLP